MWADRYPFGRSRRSFFIGGADDGPMPSGPPVLAYGAVPATLVHEPGAEVDVHVLLLEESRARLDASEPNYRCVTLHGLDLDVDVLGRVESVEAYVSRHGALTLEGATVPLGARPQAELRAALG